MNQNMTHRAETGKTRLKLSPKREQTYMVISGGKQWGPYPKGQVQSLLEQGHLTWDDMAWTEGEPSWKPLSQLLPTQQDTTQEIAYSKIARRTHRINYGMPRLVYFLFSFGVNLVTNVAVSLCIMASSPKAAIFMFLVGVIGILFLVLQRLENIGMSGWWVLVLLVPIWNLIFLVRLQALPAGYQEHKTLDGPAIAILTVGYILLAAGILISLIQLL